MKKSLKLFQFTFLDDDFQLFSKVTHVMVWNVVHIKRTDVMHTEIKWIVKGNSNWWFFA